MTTGEIGFDENLIGKEVKQETGSAEKKSTSQLLSVEGIIMLFIAAMFDIAGYISTGFYLAFGFGLVMGRIVSAVGFVVIGGWQFLRSGTIPSKKSGDAGGAATGAAKKIAKKFFKKHWKKLALEAAPVAGDLVPSFILIVYSELK